MIDERYRIFSGKEYDDTYSRDIALTGLMLYPNSVEKRKSYIFRATIYHYRQISEGATDAVKIGLSQTFEKLLVQLGSWQWLAEHEEKAETQPLEQLFTSRFIRGHIAAQLLLLMINKNISIFEAASYYTGIIENNDGKFPEYIDTIKRYKHKLSETDLSGNVWREFKDVSPLFVPTALVECNISHPFIEFDNFQTKELSIDYITRDGFVGFCELARRYREIATYRHILDENTVWKNTVPDLQ